MSKPITTSLAACAVLAMSFSTAAYAEPASSPPALDKELAVLAKSAPCVQESVAATSATSAAPMLVKDCHPLMPSAWKSRLKKQKVMASCGSLFDLDAQGRPQNIETRCSISTNGEPLSDEWRSFHARTLGSLSAAAVTFQTYEPETSGRQTARTNIFAVNNYSFERMTPAEIKPFARLAAAQ